MKWMAFIPMFFFLAAAAQAGLVTKKVEYSQGGTVLEGFLAYPEGLVGKRPGVLVVPEWWGLNDYARSRAEQIAARGYVVFAADMYGKGVTTSDPTEAGKLAGQFKGKPLMAERAQAALDVLKREEHVDPAKICAIGFCFGGTTVLKLAFSGADLLGVASFHGEMPLPEGDEAKRLKASILVLHGAADPFTSAEERGQFERALEAAGADWQLVLFGGAKHSFTNPEADRYGLKGVGYNEEAAKTSFEYLWIFFDRLFGEKPRAMGGSMK